MFPKINVRKRGNKLKQDDLAKTSVILLNYLSMPSKHIEGHLPPPICPLSEQPVCLTILLTRHTTVSSVLQTISEESEH